MKIRNGFVSNSSSCAFMIYNKSNKNKTLTDFAKENSYLVDEFLKEYNFITKNITKENFIGAAKNYNDILIAKKNTYVILGDEQRNVFGEVCDYILRSGGQSKNFSWKFEEFLR